jgi:hypothetical protein
MDVRKYEKLLQEKDLVSITVEPRISRKTMKKK